MHTNSTAGIRVTVSGVVKLLLILDKYRHYYDKTGTLASLFGEYLNENTICCSCCLVSFGLKFHSVKFDFLVAGSYKLDLIVQVTSKSVEDNKYYIVR